MHPYLSSGAVFDEATWTVTLDRQNIRLDEDAFAILYKARRLLDGRTEIADCGLPDSARRLVEALVARGVVYDLRVTDGGVDSAQFSDYLYASVSSWRQNKPADLWPWRRVQWDGQARIGYLQGIIMENMHYVNAAVTRQSPMAAHALSPALFDLVKGFVLGEGDHGDMFVETLVRWGFKEEDVRRSVPLPATVQFISLQEHLAHRSILDYLAGSAVLEVDPGVYHEVGDPYESWARVYKLDEEILEPVRAHIRTDVLEGHFGLFREAALASGSTIPLVAASSAMLAARHVFAGTRTWQRSIFEHYQVESKGFPLSLEFAAA